ncbi:universal stress protein [Halobaculum marinum]|uniref:Universal stress protein n=1 Tax=Halobaculum marinum TaxID=3031996 RepID=A0ABD5WQJ1_9EURY|nr:universal stress protein [Halobaculum sp. DT55]
MGLLVPYDGSALSKAALIRAAQFDEILEEGVTTITVVPRNNVKYARERGWIGDDDAFDEETVLANLRETIDVIAPDVTTEFVVVGRGAPYGTIANRIRRYARNHDVSIVFIGSENAGRMVGSLSVGSAVSAGGGYDTMIVSQPVPSKVKKLEEALPSEELLEEEVADAT